MALTLLGSHEVAIGCSRGREPTCAHVWKHAQPKSRRDDRKPNLSHSFLSPLRGFHCAQSGVLATSCRPFGTKV